MGRLLDLGTTIRQEDDSRDLFEKVFQKLDRDSSKTVNRREFQEYFRPEQVDGEVCHATAGSNVPSAPSPAPTNQLSGEGEVEADSEDMPPVGCCGGGGKRLKPRSKTQALTRPQSQPAIPLASNADVSMAKTSPHAVLQQAAAPSSPRANISPEELEELQEELTFLRSQLKKKGEEGRRIHKESERVKSDIEKLRSEYNLQSLKQDMLVHMWSMHLLDADLAEED